MKVFVDTSGFYAHACKSDDAHKEVIEVFRDLGTRQAVLVTNSYVLSETMGLLQIRHGFTAVSQFVANVVPLIRVLWVQQSDHEQAWSLMQREQKRHLTIVDASAMVMMTRESIRSCVGLDLEFRRQGFVLLPEERALKA